MHFRYMDQIDKCSSTILTRAKAEKSKTEGATKSKHMCKQIDYQTRQNKLMNQETDNNPKMKSNNRQKTWKCQAQEH